MAKLIVIKKIYKTHQKAEAINIGPSFPHLPPPSYKGALAPTHQPPNHHPLGTQLVEE